MRKKYEKLPLARNDIKPNQIVGIIGCGNYSFSNIAYYLNKKFGRIIATCMDADINHAASLSDYYRVPNYSSSAEEVIKNKNVQFIYIASNHASHAEYAIEALLSGKDVYIEKPHVVSEDQLVRLVNAIKRSWKKVFLGFNRPGSHFGRIIREFLEKEAGSGMYNWFVSGHALDPGHWYYKPEEGGRVLGNLCHWTDFILRLVPKNTYPIEINPTRAVKADSDIVVTYKFGENSIAIISFSAKGATFEGVREKFNAHKGNCLISMNDNKDMTIEVLDIKKKYYNLFRDQGHRQNIQSAFDHVSKNLPYDHKEQIGYIWNTGYLFLKTKEALETNREIIVRSYEEIYKSRGI